MNERTNKLTQVKLQDLSGETSRLNRINLKRLRFKPQLKIELL